MLLLWMLVICAQVAELVDALVSGARTARCASSSLVLGTINKKVGQLQLNGLFIYGVQSKTRREKNVSTKCRLVSVMRTKFFGVFENRMFEKCVCANAQSRLG